MELVGAALKPPRGRMVERLRVCSHATRAAMSRAAAVDVAVEIRARLARAAGVRMIFAAAPSQAEMIEALVGNRSRLTSIPANGAGRGSD